MEPLGAAGRESGPAVGSRGLRCRAVPLLAALVLAVTLALAPRAEAYVYWTRAPDDRARQPRRQRASTSFIRRHRRLHAGWRSTARTSTGHAASGSDEFDRARQPRRHGRRPELHHHRARRPSACGVAVDGAHVYWASDYSELRSIGRANLDGTGVDQNFIATGDVALRGGGRRRRTSTGTARREQIGRANLDGTSVDQSFIDRRLGYPSAAGGRRGAHLLDDHRRVTDGGPRSGAPTSTARRWTRTSSPTPYGTVRGGGRRRRTSTGRCWRPITVITRANLDGSERGQRPHPQLTLYPCEVAVDALSSPPPRPPHPPRPSNDFSFGKVNKNKSKGTAKLTVEVPGPGELDLAKTNGVKADEEWAEAAGEETLIVRARGGAKQKLNADGQAKVDPKVTFTTPDGGEPNTERKRIKLIKG